MKFSENASRHITQYLQNLQEDKNDMLYETLEIFTPYYTDSHVQQNEAEYKLTKEDIQRIEKTSNLLDKLEKNADEVESIDLYRDILISNIRDFITVKNSLQGLDYDNLDKQKMDIIIYSMEQLYDDLVETMSKEHNLPHFINVSTMIKEVLTDFVIVQDKSVKELSTYLLTRLTKDKKEQIECFGEYIESNMSDLKPIKKPRVKMA